MKKMHGKKSTRSFKLIIVINTIKYLEGIACNWMGGKKR
jgi:hypothetical protein